MTSTPFASGISLREIEDRVRQTTFGRVRNLTVERVGEQVVLRGCVPSQHTKQLALHGALQLLSGDCLCECLTVG